MLNRFNEKLVEILNRYEYLEDRLGSGGLSSEEIKSYSKEYSEISELSERIKEFNNKKFQLSELQKNLNSFDKEMLDLVKEEVFDLEKVIEVLEKEIKLLLIPADKDDQKNAILEIRAGTGGEEASLFANNIFEMYRGYATKMKWKYEILDFNQTDLGGVKEIIILISGKNVFGNLKFESGVHRIQRVPVTESSGRVHTSTATVAVLPEVEDIDINIKPEDLRIDVFRASGAGGQHVNTTDSAVRITHLPSGIVVSQQDERSQHKNKAKAMKILQARLYDLEKQKKDSEISENRKLQVGTGGRSERIRTYNYHDNRVTDHRINFTIHKLEQILSGDALNEVINELINFNIDEF
jgi:peptide chain release factor 1